MWLALMMTSERASVSAAQKRCLVAATRAAAGRSVSRVTGGYINDSGAERGFQANFPAAAGLSAAPPFLFHFGYGLIERRRKALGLRDLLVDLSRRLARGRDQLVEQTRHLIDRADAQ